VSLPHIAPWSGQDITLYHGTLAASVSSVLRGVNPMLGTGLKDFGRGFYTTTKRAQAIDWANDLVDDPQKDVPAVIEFELSRDELSWLEILFFIRADPGAADFWSFVKTCRTVVGDHRRRKRAGWFDVVAGPVTGTWQKQTVIADSDQISFHTRDAADLLDNSKKRQVL
jgi:hypothetical protein